jgi:hypothetical protein
MAPPKKYKNKREKKKAQKELRQKRKLSIWRV